MDMISKKDVEIISLCANKQNVSKTDNPMFGL